MKHLAQGVTPISSQRGCHLTKVAAGVDKSIILGKAKMLLMG